MSDTDPRDLSDLKPRAAEPFPGGDKAPDYAQDAPAHHATGATASIENPEPAPENPLGDFLDYTLFCAGCGYALRHLPRTGGCPECGRPVADSIGVVPVHANNREQTDRFLTGLWLTLTAAVSALLIPWLLVLLGVLSIGGRGGDGIVVLWALMVLAGNALWAIGVVALTHTASDSVQWRGRRVLAVFAGVCNAVGAALVVFVLFGLMQTHGDEGWARVLLTLLVFTLAARVVAVWCLGGYLPHVLLGLGVTSGHGLLQAMRWAATLSAAWVWLLAAMPWAIWITGTDHWVDAAFLGGHGVEISLTVIFGGGLLAANATALFVSIGLAVLLRHVRLALREHGCG